MLEQAENLDDGEQEETDEPCDQHDDREREIGCDPGRSAGSDCAVEHEDCVLDACQSCCSHCICLLQCGVGHVDMVHPCYRSQVVLPRDRPQVAYRYSDFVGSLLKTTVDVLQTDQCDPRDTLSETVTGSRRHHHGLVYEKLYLLRQVSRHGDYVHVGVHNHGGEPHADQTQEDCIFHHIRRAGQC